MKREREKKKLCWNRFFSGICVKCRNSVEWIRIEFLQKKKAFYKPRSSINNIKNNSIRWMTKNCLKCHEKKNCLSNKNAVNGKTNTYLETLSGANDISADPLIKSPMIPLHRSAEARFQWKNNKKEREKKNNRHLIDHWRAHMLWTITKVLVFVISCSFANNAMNVARFMEHDNFVESFKIVWMPMLLSKINVWLYVSNMKCRRRHNINMHKHYHFRKFADVSHTLKTDS